MPPAKKTAKNLEAAFREAGFDQVDLADDYVRVRLGGPQELRVRPVSAGHGRPQELRNALAHEIVYETGDVSATFVAGHFTTGALEILKEEGVNYLDDAQFVFRSADPPVVIRQHRATRRETKPVARVGLGGRTGVAVQTVLLDGREWWQVTDLAKVAGVAAGTAQAALARLEELGLAEALGSGPKKRRRLVDKDAILDRWIQDAARERRPLLTTYLPAQGPVDLARQVSGRLAVAGIDHAVTGACGALLVAPHVTDVRRCEVWIDSAVGETAVLNALGTAPAEKGGNVTVLRAINDAPLHAHVPREGVEVANPLRLYADLLEDPRRGEEQAEFLRETVLKL
jgi:hypothetical protein